MLFYLASFPRSGNTLCRQLIKHYFDRLSSSVYSLSEKVLRFEGAEDFEVDADSRFKVFHTDQGNYRVLVDDAQTLLTPEFRRELAKSRESFFVKTHELPFDEYFEGEFVIRVVRHPGATLWSYYLYLLQVEHRDVTLETVITGISDWNQWSRYTEAWLNAENRLGDQYFKIKYEDMLRNEQSFIEKVQDWTSLPLKQPLGTFPNFDHWHQNQPEFYRSGKTDEWKNKFSLDQIMLLYEHHAGAMAKEGYALDFAPPPYSVDYETRIHLAKLGMVDVESVPKAKHAGEVIEEGELRYQIMFNGVKVPADSYYGTWYTELIRECKGHHEPQEEYVFNTLVNNAPEGARMIELGSYWAFYSTWFLTHVKNGQAILVEPSPDNIAVSMGTLSLNNCRANLVFAAIGEQPPEIEKIYLGGAHIPNYVAPLRTVDELMESYGFDHLYVLHSDIQGAEVKMLDGAATALEARRIDYLVISTHSNDIHQTCLDKLAAFGYQIVAEHDIFESYTYDGLIVACSEKFQDDGSLKIHKRNSTEWSWEDALKTWNDKETHLEKHFSVFQSGGSRLASEHLQNEKMLPKAQQPQQRNSPMSELRARIEQLQQQNEQLQQQIETIRSRKISRIMRAIGKPLV
jgi:FkbM family methyltransferase